MEEEHNSLRNQGTEEHLDSLPEKSKMKETENNRKEDATTGKNKDLEKKDHNADQL